jgi:hypothetical protein
VVLGSAPLHFITQSDSSDVLRGWFDRDKDGIMKCSFQSYFLCRAGQGDRTIKQQADSFLRGAVCKDKRIKAYQDNYSRGAFIIKPIKHQLRSSA